MTNFEKEQLVEFIPEDRSSTDGIEIKRKQQMIMSDRRAEETTVIYITMLI